MMDLKLKVLLLLSCLSFIAATPEADADPDAQASADPEADPQFYGSRPPYNVGGSRPPYNPDTSTCGLTNQCCGMANENCCAGGKRCYTVWERKCENEDNPMCRVQVDQQCKSIRVKDCRIVTDVQQRSYQVSKCIPKPMTKCFTYQKKVCDVQTKVVSREITWENEKLQKISEEAGKECYTINSFNCQEYNVTETVYVREQRTRLVNDTQSRCRMVQVQGPGQVIEVPVPQVVYRRQCYNINVPSCSVGDCQTGSCNIGQSVCSATQYQTNTVCPQGGIAGQNCQQVREPICSGGFDGGNCNAGQQQQCCASQTQQVCRQVPVRTTKMVKQTIPGQVQWKQECQQYPFTRTEYYYEKVPKVNTRTKRKCTPVQTQDCHEYTIPKYQVIPEKKTETIQVTLPQCESRIVEDRYCHTFSTGEVECRNDTIIKRFKINKIKCDREVDRPICFNIPKTVCQMGVTANCRMVPREVCQDSCSNSPLCQTCDQFRNGPGFGSCPTSTCGNFVANDPFINVTMPGAITGATTLPENIYGGGYIGGEGMYPGIGGEGMYPGVGIGGEGMYPGGIGGEGMYPGGVGGEGMYPGGVGGEGMYPGGVGGEGMYPGGNYGVGGEGMYPGGYGGGGYYSAAQGYDGYPDQAYGLIPEASPMMAAEQLMAGESPMDDQSSPEEES